MRLAALLLLLSACWRGGESAAPAEPEPPPPTAPIASSPHNTSRCRELGDHIRTLIRESNESIAPQADAYGDVLEHRCDADAWSTELRDCLTQASSLHDTDPCERLATDEQRRAIDADLATIGGN